LHMHAEDEFSAGSYGSAKRDAVRVLEGSFPVRIVVEGPSLADASPLVAEIDRLVALGKWGHLPVGGHKTRGAGWGRWESDAWDHCTIEATGAWEPTPDTPKVQRAAQGTPYPAVPRDTPQTARIEANSGSLPGSTALTLGHAACLAAAALGEPPAAWWCEPSIDFGVTEAPVTFGVTLPAESELRVDEAMFFTRTAAWRAARGASGWRTLLLREVADGTPGSRAVEVVFTPARLHADGTRFAAKFGATGGVLIRQWLEGGSPIGFTLEVRAGESRC
ncbi:MAG TPA: hypothetical protein VK689_06295, partial [Armatimonadota bacterium]|nr:hypothetical protein [Armatimonadota bacterium]